MRNLLAAITACAVVGAFPARAQDGWFVESSAGAAWVATLDQAGHNLDDVCYPTNLCTTTEGYRWYYDLQADRATAWGFAVGYGFNRLSVDVSAGVYTANLSQRFRTITYLDGTPVEPNPAMSYSNTIIADVRSLTTRTFALNAYYRLANGAIRPYAGAGAGVSMLKLGGIFFQSQYWCVDDLCALDDPSTLNSRQSADVTDTGLAQRLFVGADYVARDGLLIGVRMTAGRSDDLTAEGTYDEHPKPDLKNTTTVGNVNHVSITLRLKYVLGK